MTSKERVLKALSKDQMPDRVPLFYWDVPEFGQRLMAHLGLNSRDELLEYLDVDFRWVEPEYIGPSLFSTDKLTKTDIWGVGYSKIINGEYWYWEADHFPLQGVTQPEVLDDFQWPKLEWFDFESLNEQLDKYRDYAIMTAPGYSSPGLFRIIQRLLGREHFMTVMMEHPKFFGAVVDKVNAFYIGFIERFFEIAQDRIDFIRIADDYGLHDGLMISKDHWEQYCKPSIEMFLEAPKRYGVHFYMHSCGAVRKLLPEFIQIGAEVLDPIQTRANGMSPAGLKKDFGSMICFSGGLDEELLLRQSTPDKVKEGVMTLLNEMAYNGGFFLGPSHKLKVETPIENVLAMYEAVKEWNYSTV